METRWAIILSTMFIVTIKSKCNVDAIGKDIGQWNKFQYIILVFSEEMVGGLILYVP